MSDKQRKRFAGGSRRRREVKARLMQEQGGKCAYCLCAMRLPRDEFDRALDTATVDHVIPLSKAGDNRVANFVLACLECNRKKADKVGLRTVSHAASPRSPSHDEP